MLRLLGTLLGSAAFWVLFVSDVKPEDMIVGAVCTLLTVVFSYYITRNSSVAIDLRLTDVVQMWRMPAYLMTGSWEIVKVLFMDLFRVAPAESLFRAAPFENLETALGNARRVLAVAYTTATPNFIVVGIDTKTGGMLFHQLSKSEVLTMTRKLGAHA